MTIANRGVREGIILFHGFHLHVRAVLVLPRAVVLAMHVGL